MRYSWLGCLCLGSLLFAGTQDSDNVNTRYKVETVIVSGNGWIADFSFAGAQRLSSGLRKQISALIGGALNPSALDDIATRLRKELDATTVTRHVMRGATPAYVKVVFEVEDKGARFDLAVPKFLYNASQGGSGALEGTAKARHNSLALGLVSDGDELVERYTGLTARYENTRLGTDCVHLQFEFDSFHEQWNRATLEQLAPGPAGAPEAATAAYRTRQNFEPAVTFVIAEPLTLTVGASFERFQDQYPAPRMEAANAAIASLRYQGQFQESDYAQSVEAVYSLRAATRVLDSDFAYARHRWSFRYRMNHGKHVVTDDLSAGFLTGRAPLFDRFVLGNSSTLRGWNKFDLDPLGGNRMVHNSVEYRYGCFEAFYDAGAIWDGGVEPAVARQGAGVGLRQGSFSLAVAFPIRQGRADPIFMMGMNY
jgi:hypothetical protein